MFPRTESWTWPLRHSTALGRRRRSLTLSLAMSALRFSPAAWVSTHQIPFVDLGTASHTRKLWRWNRGKPKGDHLLVVAYFSFDIVPVDGSIELHKEHTRGRSTPRIGTENEFVRQCFSALQLGSRGCASATVPYVASPGTPYDQSSHRGCDAGGWRLRCLCHICRSWPRPQTSAPV